MFDVFYAMTLMDNVSFLQDLKVCVPFFPLLLFIFINKRRIPVWSRSRNIEFLLVQLANSASGWHETRRRNALWERDWYGHALVRYGTPQMIFGVKSCINSELLTKNGTVGIGSESVFAVE